MEENNAKIFLHPMAIYFGFLISIEFGVFFLKLFFIGHFQTGMHAELDEVDKPPLDTVKGKAFEYSESLHILVKNLKAGNKHKF